MNEYGDLVTKLLVTIVTVALPILLVWLKQYIDQKRDQLKGEVGQAQWAQIEMMVRLFCEAAEQTGLWDAALQTGEQKKAWVLTQMDGWLKGQGLPVDVNAVSAAVESVILGWNRSKGTQVVRYRVLPIEEPEPKEQ